jgi:hypothetical protein
MSASSALLILLDEIRKKTLMILDAAPEDALLFAPKGTQNHIAWHAGHVLWIGDVLTIEPTTGKRELPLEWETKFGMNCTPPSQTKDWPPKISLLAMLCEQHKRLRQIIAQLGDDELSRAPKIFGGPKPLAYYITHGLHDEANHQGEMYLLLKMHRARAGQ